MKKYFLLAAIAVSITLLFSGCKETEQKRYLVLHMGQHPIFLDTKTHAVYVIEVGFKGSIKKISKTSLPK